MLVLILELTMKRLYSYIEYVLCVKILIVCIDLLLVWW